jgi:hypothetical protein
MYMTLSRFLARPRSYSKRKLDPRTKAILLSIDTVDEKKSGNLLKFMVKSSKSDTKYECDILLYTEEVISGNTEVRFRCSCPSFIYEFETLLYHNGALYGEPNSKRLPKKDHGLFVCKHLYLLIVSILNIGTITKLRRRIHE